MIDYKFESEKIMITAKFPMNFLNEFIEEANDRDLGFMLMSHGFHYPYTEDDARAFIEKNRESGNEAFTIDFYIFYGKHFAGVIGLSDIDYENSRSHVGYWIGKQYRNLGIAGEALSLVVEFSKKTLKLHSLYTTAHTSNIPSIIVLTKNGFSLEGMERDCFRYKEKFYSAFLFSLLL
jgi:RimJ/RimL family protein N-acetyltransferase